MKKEKVVMGKVARAFVLLTVWAMFAGVVPVAAATTWYVDDSGGADFTSIQDAVDAANDGDTIFVRDGTYTENVAVNKDHLTIKSENGADSTIVQAANPDDHVFEVTADYVKVSGFTVKGATGHSKAGIYLKRSSICTITNNICKNITYERGIYLYFSSSNTITNNICLNNGDGIRLEYSSSNIITNNTCSDNAYGGIVLALGANNILKNNSCSTTGKVHLGHWGGIQLYGSDNDIVIENTFENCGIGIHGQSIIDFTTHTIEDNTVNGKPIYYYKNSQDGIVPEDAGQVIIANCSDITIKNINASSTFYGIELAYTSNSIVENNIANTNEIGIYLTHSSNNIIRDNTCSNSHGGGIYLRYSNSGNTIMSNNCSNNFYGMELVSSTNNIIIDNDFSSGSGSVGLYHSCNNTIMNNNLKALTGISLRSSNDNYIYLNNFIATFQNVDSGDSTNIWNSIEAITYQYNDIDYTNYLGNYWSDYTDIDANNDGIWDNPYNIDSDNDNYPLVEQWEKYVFAPPAPNQPPTCAIELLKNGFPIANINVGDFFDIYVGDSTDDQGIKEVRFSSDDAQEGNPTGEWTDWYDWDTSSWDWNAANKIKAWSFATGGDKEVWAEVKDGDGQTDKCSANIYANQLPIAKPVITSPLEITPIKDIYYVGDNLNAEFTIANRGGEPVTFDVLTVGGRLNGWCPTEGCPDFTHKSLTLQPGESYHYDGSLTLTQSGNYHFFIAYYITNPTPDEKKLLDENNWNTCVDLGEGLNHTDRIKNIIALEEEISSPDTVSELRDRINHNLQRQVKYPPYLPDPNSFESAVATVWADFTSWRFQTPLIEKYDDLYQTGIDYDCLRFKALKNAGDSLDRGDIVSAKKYLQKSYTYGILSEMSFGAAAEVFENNLEAGEMWAEEIQKRSEVFVQIGLAAVNPVAAKAADYIYIGVDYAVDRVVVGEEEAFKSAIVNVVVTTIFNEIKFGDLGDRTIADYTENRIGKVTFPMLQEAFQNNEPFQFALSKIIKECGVEIEEAIAEDIAMRILNELEQAVDFKQIEAKSPVEVQVYGSQGEVTGLLSGAVEHGIPRSLYCKGTVTILYPLDSYRYEISGTDEGSYGLDITSVADGEATIFTATDIPTAAGAIHEYSVDWAALSQGGEGVTVQVDSDGDGTFEYTFTADNELTQEEFLSGSDGEPIPEFTTIAIPVAIVLGLIFIISRRKRKE